MAIITHDDLSRIRRNYKNKKIVFCSGVFDLTHAGHALFLEKCKKEGDVLVVAVGEDSSLYDLGKGRGRPVFNEDIRLKMVDSLKPVDYTLLGLRPERNPLSFMETMFSRLRPDIYVINSDAFDIPYRRFLAKKYNMKIKIFKRTCPKSFECISTTGIIKKIKEGDIE